MKVGERLASRDGATCSRNFCSKIVPGAQLFTDLLVSSQLLHRHLHRLTSAGLDFATFCTILVQAWVAHKLFQEIFGYPSQPVENEAKPMIRRQIKYLDSSLLT